MRVRAHGPHTHTQVHSPHTLTHMHDTGGIDTFVIFASFVHSVKVGSKPARAGSWPGVGAGSRGQGIRVQGQFFLSYEHGVGASN